MPDEVNYRDGSSMSLLKKMLNRKKDGPKEEKSLPEFISAEERFQQLLRQIDFSRSRLPKELLGTKSDQRQPKGDLEYTVMWLLSQLQGSAPLGIRLPEIEALDEKLCRLIRKFKETVDMGYPQAAKTARAALTKGFRDIRLGLSNMSREEQNEDGFREYVGDCVAYLDRWMTLIDYTMMADVAQDNVRKAEAGYRKFLEDHEKLLDEFELEIIRDRDKLADYYAVAQSTDTGASLTKSQMELRQRMIEYGVQRATGKVKEVTWQQLSNQQTLLLGKIEVLRVGVMQSPLPNVNRQAYDMAMQEMLEKMASADKEIESAILEFADLSGKIDAMEHMAGAEAARNYAAQSVTRLVQEVTQQQNRDLNFEHL